MPCFLPAGTPALRTCAAPFDLFDVTLTSAERKRESATVEIESVEAWMELHISSRLHARRSPVEQDTGPFEVLNPTRPFPIVIYFPTIFLYTASGGVAAAAILKICAPTSNAPSAVSSPTTQRPAAGSTPCSPPRARGRSSRPPWPKSGASRRMRGCCGRAQID